MTSKLKEDEKNEKIIRGLLKKSGNRKCINCNVLGPQYVCTTFSIFICSTCSGIHREFTHRVKSVSMAKFTPQEITALQAGGNERAKETFFKDADAQRLSASDSSNVDKLRSFIKHVYVDRRYTGERSIDKPPRVKNGDKEKPNENGRSDPSQSSSRRPPIDNGRRYSDRPSIGDDVRRSPGYGQENQRHGDFGRSPAGIVSDWRRENRFSNRKKPDDSGDSDGKSKPEIESTDNQNDSSISTPPVVQPVGDLLGEDVGPLQICEPSRTDSSIVADGTVIAQLTESSSDMASSTDNPTELKTEISLIDFDASPEPAVAATVTQAQLSVVQPTSTPVNDSFSFLDKISENNVAPTLLALPAPTGQITETNAGTSQELPMDLFTAAYSATPYQQPAWQTGQFPGMGFPGQYNTVMSMNLSNPFDANGGSSPAQVAAFPSVSSLHAALPNMANNGVSVHASNGRPSWMPPHTPSYPSAVPPHVSSFGSATPGAYMGQQLHSNMLPSRPQGLGGFGSDGISFGSLNPAVATPNPSLGGNPFG
ncbi:hypothetical protein RND81_06G156400 [Saponaria officinalis]|uniref:Arf-GAP domain-containing protein n=1 Tax=Saponaria officinalis TaxID=3572 RepID=A0AAW1KB57_SAPOF